MKTNVFTLALWTSLVLMFVGGYTLGFVFGSIAVDRSVKNTVNYIESLKKVK
jgi:uncharacterized membrane protein SpoIIM required for sporulation